MSWINGEQAGRVYGKDKPVLTNASQRRGRANTFFMTNAFLALAALLGVGLFGSAAEAAESSEGSSYQLGQGYQLGQTGLTIGGYSTLSYEKPRSQTGRLALDDASLFIWWEGDGRWKFFSELDYENALASRKISGERGAYVALERLYFDYTVNDATTVRLGKFLTPIGRWNLVHATPLTWTTSRPLVTKNVFPTNATGVMLNGTLATVGAGLEYSLYHSNGHEIRANPAVDPFYEATGVHLSYPVSANGQLGLSYARFEQNSAQEEKKRLWGLDYHWAYRRYEVSAEAVSRASNSGSSFEERGAFVQGVAPLSDKLYAVGRYESFRQALQPKSLHQWTLGLTYRMTPALVFKAEWSGTKDNRIGAPEGFMSSVSVLF